MEFFYDIHMKTILRQANAVRNRYILFILNGYIYNVLYFISKYKTYTVTYIFK